MVSSAPHRVLPRGDPKRAVWSQEGSGCALHTCGENSAVRLKGRAAGTGIKMPQAENELYSVRAASDEVTDA